MGHSIAPARRHLHPHQRDNVPLLAQRPHLFSRIERIVVSHGDEAETSLAQVIEEVLRPPGAVAIDRVQVQVNGSVGSERESWHISAPLALLLPVSSSWGGSGMRSGGWPSQHLGVDLG